MLRAAMGGAESYREDLARPLVQGVGIEPLLPTLGGKGVYETLSEYWLESEVFELYSIDVGNDAEECTGKSSSSSDTCTRWEVGCTTNENKNHWK